jgi:hypothetical protein
VNRLLNFRDVASFNGSLVAAAIAIATIALALFVSAPVPAPRILHTVQLTSDGQRKLSLIFYDLPLLVTDGLRVYFTEIRNDHATLAAVSVSGGETIPIHTPFNNAVFLNISPGGSELLVADGYQFDDLPLWIVPVLGGSPRRLGNISGHSGSWSPDGRLLRFYQGDPKNLTGTLLEASVNGTNLRPLLPDRRPSAAAGVRGHRTESISCSVHLRT